MTPSLYQLSAEYDQLLHKLADLDLDAQTIQDTIESTGLMESIGERAQSRMFVARTFRARADTIDAEIKRLTKLKRHCQAVAERVEDSTLELLQRSSISKAEGPLMVVKVQNNPPAVDVFEPGLLPAEYLRQPEPPAPVPDKDVIKAALKAGFDVPGARLTQSCRLAVT